MSGRPGEGRRREGRRREGRRREGRRRDERGSGTVLAAAVMLVLLAVGVGVVGYAGYAVTAHRAAGAADVVALSGAHARARGSDPCRAAHQSARANQVELADCTVAGDEVDYAITVTVVRSHPRALPGLPTSVRVSAVAGALS